MSNELTLTEPANEIIEQKRTSWGQMGIVVYKQELQLQAEAQAVINSIVHPETIEDVPVAEMKLKEVKAAQKTIEGKRKEITSRFDDVIKRLMEPEKSFSDPIKTLSDNIITLKKAHEEDQRKKQAISLDVNAIRMHYANEHSRIASELKAKVNNLVARCYEKALNENIEPDNVEAYLNASKEALMPQHFCFKVNAFVANHPDNSQLSEQLFNEVNSVDVSVYINDFKKEVDFKFSDYSIAYNNKADALKLAKDQEEENARKIKEQRESQEMAARLELAATPVDVTPVFTKELKKTYEVDMPETVESVLKIMAAFSANINLCLPKLKVNKWFAFTPAQAANVLGKLKTDDNSFQPSGITFKQVDKL